MNTKKPTPIDLISINPEIEKYMSELLTNTDNDTLTKMERLAVENNFPIVNRLIGIFLKNIAQMINAKRVFEFGSGYGYSAYWFAQAVGKNGQVICTDGDLENKKKAQIYLNDANLGSQIEFYHGWAQDVFQQTRGQFDICYNDAKKEDYPQIWKLAKERIRSGGLYIADNVLWQGRVTMTEHLDIIPSSTEAIIEHNKLIFSDPLFDSFINPTRDGVIVARRK